MFPRLRPALMGAIASSPVPEAAGGGGPVELYPDPNVDDAAGYSARFSGSALVFDAGVTAGITNTIGDLNTALLAATSISTVYEVTLMIADWVNGSPRLRLRAGTISNGFGVNGNGPFTTTVTSGSGTATGMSVLDTSDSDGDFKVVGISIFLA